jgi:hypothetical protein
MDPIVAASVISAGLAVGLTLLVMHVLKQRATDFWRLKAQSTMVEGREFSKEGQPLSDFGESDPFGPEDPVQAASYLFLYQQKDVRILPVVGGCVIFTKKKVFWVAESSSVDIFFNDPPSEEED